MPIPNIFLLRKGFSKVIKAGSAQEEKYNYSILGLEKALKLNNVDIRLFGKPLAWEGRRLGVILSSDRENAEAAQRFIKIKAN